MAELSVIGKEGLKDPTTIGKMTGALDFCGDHFPGQKLICRTLLSTIAHGTIASIDTSAAEALPGVKATTTFEDCPVLRENITFWGQEVVAVAAVDEETANQALELIDVEYNEETPVVDEEDALAPGAPLAGVWDGTNVRQTEVVRGDINEGFTQAEVTIEGTVDWGERWQHQEAEPHAALAHWIGDHLYFWTSSQNPYGQRAAAAGALGLPLNKVHLTSHGSGAGHGNKHGNDYGVIAAVLARKAGMPVLYQKSRREHVITSTRQHPYKAEYKIGALSDGTLTAIDVTMYGGAGGNGSGWAGGLSYLLRASWKCPNGLFKAVDVATNTPPTGAFRCVADPCGNVIHTVMFDHLAAELGMDPLELKLKNAITSDMVHQDMMMPFAAVAISDCLEAAANGIGWSSKWHTPGAYTLPDGRLHGIGIAGGIDSHGVNAAFWGLTNGAILMITMDGTALVNPGQSHCAGSIISMLHIVAETLGMDYESVQLGDWGDTDTCADGGFEGGSTRVSTEGPAYVRACEDALSQVFEMVAPQLETTTDNLTAKDGKIFVTDNPSSSMTWAEAMSVVRNTIVGRGYTWQPTLRRQVHDWPVGTPCLVQGCEATAAEIAVDPETGEIEILDMVNAIDCGRAVYRKGCEKQIMGGCEIQVGQALFYQHIIDKATGATLNPSFIDHKQPTSLDMHEDRHKAVLVESDSASGPYGAHGIGEPAVNAYACILAAFYNATGIWVSGSPISPWKALKAMGKV
ncbi:MAG: xanthine dehydrogenase family protein molybdopterin-binding subunit [Dehalococcoidia bacterium]|nr:MAG: xanthine dehydrogenase family protein molybdopterin-binding subunit [Dehalococcoidia bacterium]